MQLSVIPSLQYSQKDYNIILLYVCNIVMNRLMMMLFNLILPHFMGFSFRAILPCVFRFAYHRTYWVILFSYLDNISHTSIKRLLVNIYQNTIDIFFKSRIFIQQFYVWKMTKMLMHNFCDSRTLNSKDEHVLYNPFN